MKTEKKISTVKTKEIECPRCGMAKEDWPDKGCHQGKTTYCCEGCASDTGCTCA